MRTREYTVLFTLALIWGASFLFIKVAVREMSPTTVVAGRLAFSVLTLALIVAVRPALFRGWRRYWRLALVVGIINNIIPFLLITWGELRISSGVASILNATTPLFTVLLANWWPGAGREALTLRRGGGMLLGFVGVGVLVGPSALNLSSGGAARIIGEVAVLIAAASYGVGALLIKRYAGASPLVGPLTMQGAALLIMLPIALVAGLPTQLPSLKAVGAVVTLGIFGTAIAYLLSFWLIQHVGATRAMLVTYLLPCTAVIWGVLLLGETVSWNTLVGLVLVLLGTMVTNGTLNGLLNRCAPSSAVAKRVA